MAAVVADCILSLADCQQCVLVFLPGTGEIRAVESALEELAGPLEGRSKLGARLCILVLHSMVSREEQDAAFEDTPADACKVILATNIAETSITINGVRYVVDCGLVKARGYNPLSGASSYSEKRTHTLRLLSVVVVIPFYSTPYLPPPPRHRHSCCRSHFQGSVSTTRWPRGP